MSSTKKDPSLGVCVETDCKEYSVTLYFCKRHFDEFKFGVIRKDGTRPTDYEKKMDEYKRHGQGD